MLASELVVGKVYKTFSFETARAIVQEELYCIDDETVCGISKETWESDFSLVEIDNRCITSKYAQVRSVQGDRHYLWSIPCSTIREEAQF